MRRVCLERVCADRVLIRGVYPCGASVSAGACTYAEYVPLTERQCAI
jgi:hypothetical protein